MKKEIIYSKNNNIRLPYVLITPDNYKKDSHLIVELSGSVDFNKSVKEQIVDQCESNSGNSMDYMLKLLIEKLNYPVIIPIIPRIPNFYTTYFGSKVINNDFTGCDVSDSDKALLSNIDQQIKLMIEEAIEYLGIQKKAIIKGYSSTAKFATQFSILHPEVIMINLSGGTSGLSTLPCSSYAGIQLPYPIGVSDIPNFNKKEFMKISHFFYIGEEDNNNPALPKSEMSDDFDANGNRLPKIDEKGNLTFILDKDGLLLPTYSDCYTKEQINIIHDFYGDNNQIRFKKNEGIYHELQVNSIHKIYPGNHVTLFRNREQIVDDMVEFIKKVIDKDHSNLYGSNGEVVDRTSINQK